MVQLIGAVSIWLIFIIAFARNPLHKNEEGISVLVLGNVFFWICMGAGAAVYHILKWDITLFSIGVFLVVCEACMVLHIIVARRKFKVQHSGIIQKRTLLRWNKKGCACLFFCVFFVLLIMFRKFGLELKLRYTDIDAPRYYRMAVEILNGKQVSGEYLSSLMDAFFVQLARPFFDTVLCYKGMVVSHIFKQILCISMFYVLLTEICRKYAWHQALFSILFYCGYPLYNIYYGTFIHGTDGMIFVMAACYYAIRLQRKNIMYLRGIFGALLAVFGLLVCYPFYLLLLAVLLGTEGILWVKQNAGGISVKMKAGIAAAVVSVLGIGIVFAWQRIGGSWTVFLSNLAADGPTIKNPYMDFLFFLPVLVAYAGVLWKNRNEKKILLRMNLEGLAFVAVWFWLYLAGYLSSYYYYRVYQTLWMLAWLMTGHTVALLAKRKEYVRIGAYGALWGVAFLTSVLGVNTKLWNMKSEMYETDEREFFLCPMYAHNFSTVSNEPYDMLTSDEFDLYGYAAEALPGIQVAEISTYATTMQSYWYAGLTASPEGTNINYQLDDSTLLNTFASMDSTATKYLLVEKGDGECMKYYDAIFSKLDVVLENDGGYIFYNPYNTWMELITGMDGMTDGFLELCEYARVNFPAGSVQLNCQSALQQRTLAYGAYLGESSLAIMGKILPKDFISLTYWLNNEGVQYMTVLKDSEMYQYNQEYFDAQQILFENDAGMILTHVGTGWMPTEQQ